jgi:exodeoxyribonuclease-1
MHSEALGDRGCDRSVVFFDLETTGIAPAWDQILQIAAIRTDPALVEMERFEVRCRLQPHIVPHPQALLTTGLSIREITDPALPSHYEAMRAFRAWLLGSGPAVVAGYNSARFDEHFLRHALMRTLSPPYLTGQHRNRRTDVLRLVQAVAGLAPETLSIPHEEDGRAAFRLDLLAPSNGWPAGQAHDAMDDVCATLHLARLVRDRAPWLWARLMRWTDKAEVESHARSAPAFLVTETSAGQVRHTALAAFARDPSSSGAILCLDLSHDPAWLAGLAPGQLAGLVAGAHRMVRRIRTNDSPFITPLAEAPWWSLHPLGADEVAARGRKIRGDDGLRSRLIEAHAASRAPLQVPTHPEERLYERFPPKSDEMRMQRFHGAGWNERARIVEAFEDDRLRHYGRLLLAELQPDALAAHVLAEVSALVRQRLLSPGEAGGWTSLASAMDALDRLPPGRRSEPWASDYRKHLTSLASGLSPEPVGTGRAPMPATPRAQVRSPAACG